MKTKPKHKAKKIVIKEKEADRMKAGFISTVSHELRTPLATMKEFVSIIADEIPGKLNKEQKNYIGIIKDNIDRLVRLINDLSDISKIEAGNGKEKDSYSRRRRRSRQRNKNQA